MKRLDERNDFELIADHIAEECGRRGISGVFGIKQTEYPTQTWFTRMPQDGPFDDAEGKMYKFLGMTLDKLSRVFADRPVARGRAMRMRYAGDSMYNGKDGHLSKDGQYIYAFSGTAEEADDEIARLAEEFHKSLK